MTHIDSVYIRTSPDELEVTVWGHVSGSTVLSCFLNPWTMLEEYQEDTYGLLLDHVFKNQSDGTIAPKCKLSLLASALKHVYTTYVPFS